MHGDANHVYRKETELASWFFLLRVGRADTNGITIFPQICNAFQLRTTVNSVSSANPLAKLKAVIILSVHSCNVKHLPQKILILRTERMEFSSTSSNGLSCQTWACQVPKMTGCVETWECQAPQQTGCVERTSLHSLLSLVPQRLMPVKLKLRQMPLSYRAQKGDTFLCMTVRFLFWFWYFRSFANSWSSAS